MKKLSFVIPLYNSAQWLRKCLDSILNQDIPLEQMEIICVNDGSPDNSADIAHEYKMLYPNSIVVLDQENQGPSGARNTGMRQATGKYLCFVDPDDYVEPNVYGKLVRQMENDNLDMLRFNYQSVDENYQPVDKPEFEIQFDYSPKLMSGTEFLATRLDIACNIWRYMYRREIITENGIWCFTGDYYDDTPWLPLVLMQAERMNICDTVVYDYMERSDSLVKTKNPKMMKRKSDGAVLLLEYLEEERKKVERGLLNVESKWKEGVHTWYKRMEAHAVVILLTNIGVSLFWEYGAYLKQLKAMHVFPLSDYMATNKTRRKIRLANISPTLLVWLIHLKNY